ncbi:MAG: hypothetical protein U5M23_05025 [Marinagarivorans sp.]|nr:hypothetical protein [Marinagarivorans sp.]
MNKKSFKRILQFIVIAAALLPSFVLASKITPKTAGVSVTAAADADVLVIGRPNASGYSVNYFDSFTVDRPLDIVTAPLNLSANNAYLSPKVVVIISNTISIGHAITLLGTATDIVFIAPSSSGQIICNNCVFNNLLRGTFAAGYTSATLGDSSSAIGKLTTGASSKISINGLYAPGAVGFDIFSKSLTLSGVLDTNQPAIKDARGGVTNLATGNLKVGSGGFDIILGENEWDYENNKIVYSRPPTQNNSQWVTGQATQTLGGTINSIYTKISATGNLVVNSKINSKVDYAAVVPYQNMSHAPEELIALQTLGYGNLTVKSTLSSNGQVAIRSANNTYLDRASITANDIQLISGDLLRNIASSITGTQISGAAKRIQNEGELNALRGVELWADQEVANQYGGKIKAATVILNSEHQVVRNGSRTPYRSIDLETNSFLNLSSGRFLDSAGLNLQNIGTFYTLASGVVTQQGGAVMASKNYAHIVADEIYINAGAIENINPYYLAVDNQNEIQLSRELTNQVSILAQKYLSMSTPASGYIVNSSANISVASAAGKLSAQTGFFINDRYRVTTLLNRHEGSITDAINGVSYPGFTPVSTTETTTTYISKTLVYSPPGRIQTMGKAHVSAGLSTGGAIVNSLSYMELFNEAEFNSPYFLEYGLKNQGISKSSKTYTGYSSGYGLTSYTNTHASFLQNPKDLDSLFYVKKDFFALNSQVDFITLNSFDYFIDQAIHKNFAGKYEFSGGGVIDEWDYSYEWWYENVRWKTNDIESIKTTGKILVDSSYSIEIECDGSYECERSENGSSYSRTHEYSLWDEIVKYYQAVKNTVVELFAEWSWWNE